MLIHRYSFLLICLIFILKTSANEETVILDLTTPGTDYLDEFGTSLTKFIQENEVVDQLSYNFTYDITFPEGTKIDGIKEIYTVFKETMSENLHGFHVLGLHQVTTDFDSLKQMILKISLINTQKHLTFKFDTLDQNDIEKVLEEVDVLNAPDWSENNEVEEDLIFLTPQEITNEFNEKIGDIVTNYTKNHIQDSSINVVTINNCQTVDGDGKTDIFVQISSKLNQITELIGAEGRATLRIADYFNETRFWAEYTTESFPEIEFTETEYLKEGIINEVIRWAGNHWNLGGNVSTQRLVLQFDTSRPNLYMHLIKRCMSGLKTNLMELEPEATAKLAYVKFGRRGTVVFGAEITMPPVNQSVIIKLKERFPLVMNHFVELVDRSHLEEKVKQILSYRIFMSKREAIGKIVTLTLAFHVEKEDESLKGIIAEELKKYHNVFYGNSAFVVEERSSKLFLLVSIKMPYSLNRALNGIQAKEEKDAETPLAFLDFKL